MKLINGKYTLLLFFYLILAKIGYSQLPLLPDFHADPSAHLWNGVVWLYPSTDEPGSSSWQEMKRWFAYSSNDLITWKNHGQIFSLENITWAKERAYAPDCINWKGKYYFYFPAEYQIGVAVSDFPSGPFKDALGKPLIEKGECGLKVMDPCVFINQGKPFLFFGGGNQAAVVELNEDMISRKGEIQILDLQGFAEGLWVHQYGNLYYFSYPTGIKRNGKSKQVLAYSTSKNLLGPFEFSGIFLDSDSRNTQHSIIQVEDQWYLFYHIEGASPYERRVCMEKLYYGKNGNIEMVNMSKTYFQTDK